MSFTSSTLKVKIPQKAFDINSILQSWPPFLATLSSSSAKPKKRVHCFFYSVYSDLLAIKDLLPDIITHLGPKQFQNLASMFKKPGTEDIKETPEEEEEDVPNLVNQDFEEASKKETK